MADMRAGMLWLSLALLAGSATAQVEVQKVDVKPDFAWPDAGPAPIATSIGKEQVERFLTAIYEKLVKYDKLAIGEFTFAQLVPGRATLLATVSGDWRRYLWTVAVVDWDGSSVFIRTLEADPPYKLDENLVDVDGDGLPEIITNTLVTGNLGTRTLPIGWKGIFKARADYTLEDVSVKNRFFFESRIIPDLAAEEAQTLSALREDNDPELVRAAVQFVRDKYRRMLYGEKEAGLEEARSWAQSPNSDIQSLAVQVLEEIRTARAINVLTELADSGDTYIARRSKSALDAINSNKR